MRERITLLGGEFRVASRPGVGTLIVAEIPLLGGPAEGSAEGSAKTSSTSPPLQPAEG
jgi:signal transduction histidine kinase